MKESEFKVSSLKEIATHVMRSVEESLDRFGKAAANHLGAGFVMLSGALVGGLVAGAVLKPDGITCAYAASPPNVVQVPAYVDDGGDEDSDEYPKPEFKLQYEPANDEKPILHRKHLKEEVANGAAYEEGAEVVAAPEPDFVVKDELIVEIIEDESEVSSAPEVTPSPTAKSHGIKESSAQAK
jgi:hypothetical protein